MIQIRLLAPDDAEAYWAIRLEALEEVPRAFGASVEKFRTTRPEEMVDRLAAVENGSFVTRGARRHGGIVLAEAGRSAPCRLRLGRLRHARAWGQGLAAIMMESLLKRARGYRGLEEITLECFGSSIAALALYRRLGFRLVHLEPAAVEIEDEYVDLYHMALDLR